LDAAGRVPSGGEIWLQLGIGYKFVLRTSTDVLIATYDNIPSSAQPPAANDADSIMYEQGYIVTAGSFVSGTIYRIVSVGTTNFTLIGAVNNTVGTHFIATGAGTGTGTAEVSQTVETKLRQTVSVKDFGAVGNGVADDTVAVQAALSSASQRIYFPAGTYKITSVLNTITDTKILYGDGCDLVAANSASILKFSAGVQGLIFSGNAASFSQVQSLAIVGSDSGAGAAIGLTVSTPRFSAENVAVSAFGSHGVSVESAGGLNANLARFKKVASRSNFGNGFAIGLGSGVDENAITFDGCEGTSNTGYGFRNDGNHVLFLNCVTAANTAGAFFDSGNSNQYILPYVESGVGDNVDIDATSTFGVWLSGLYASSIPNFNSATSRNTWVVIIQGGFGGRLMINDVAGYTTGNQYRFENGIFAAGELSLRNVTLNDTLQSVASDSSVFRMHVPFAPFTDTNLELGAQAKRWSDVWSVNFRPGTGSIRPIWTAAANSPEGVVTAEVGSLYTRTNGGAGTTLYVKESGSGSTGWVAK
jgi:hypothetical protein